MKNGVVYLVGAGPGDIGLVTLRARELIESCDVLVYDYLIHSAILTWCRSDCQLICVGKSPGRHSIDQSAIEAILIEHAEKGKKVVRLKGGDPFVFGRGGEEAQSLATAGLRFEIIPAVTAALAAAAYAGIPLTHREYSSSICLLTGHENPEKQTFHVDFRRFAQAGDTLCIYMGMGQVRRITTELIEGGRSPDTPAAVVQWASLPRQRRLVATLETLADKTEAAGLGPPAIIFVGTLSGSFKNLDWFGKRPLNGRRIVVTRRRAQAGKLSQKLHDAGAEVLELPMIDIEPIIDPRHSEDIFRGIAAYEWIIFTSTNGVEGFFKNFFNWFEDIRSFGPIRIACNSPATAEAVQQYRLAVELVAPEADAESLAKALVSTHVLDNANVLVVAGNRNRPTLVTKLQKDGHAIVDTLITYRTEPSDLKDHPSAREFRERGADAVIFTSASTVESFAAQATNLQLMPEARRPLTCSIGPTTSQALRKCGLPVEIEAAQMNLDAVVEGLITRLAVKQRSPTR